MNANCIFDKQTMVSFPMNLLAERGQLCCFVESIARHGKFVPLAPQRSAGRGTGRGAADQKPHLSPTLSLNFRRRRGYGGQVVGGEGVQMGVSSHVSILSRKQQLCPRVTAPRDWRTWLSALRFRSSMCELFRGILSPPKREKGPGCECRRSSFVNGATPT